jgi:hypothetical protein
VGQRIFEDQLFQLMPARRNDPKEWSPVAPKEVGRLRPPWQYILCNPATYPPEIFAQVALQLIFHPERNSKNIRRADILSDAVDDVQHVNGMVCSRTIRRRLMPRNPNLDAELEQTCRLYGEDDGPASLVTYYCHYTGSVPYYVPDVLGVAFELYRGNVYVAYLPLPEVSCTDERLQRVALQLLQTIHRHW